MEKTKKLELAEQIVQKRGDRETQLKETFTALYDNFAEMLSRGIEINGVERLDLLAERLDVFTKEASRQVERLADVSAHINELEIPDVHLEPVLDERLLKKLDELGDNGEILIKLEQLDETFSNVKKALTKGKRPQDYSAVRIVVGEGENLRFLSDFSFPVFNTGGGSSGGLTDSELRASPIDVDTGLVQPTTPADIQPISATNLPLPSGAATSAKQDDIITAINAIVSTPDTPLSTYTYIQKDTSGGTYKYYGYADANTAGAWAIKRITIASNLAEYVSGSSGYSTAWTNRVSQTYQDIWAAF